MLSRLASSLAMAAMLAAILVGLSRGGGALEIGKRAILAYLAAYLAAGSLLALGRLALHSEEREPEGRSEAAHGTERAADPPQG